MAARLTEDRREEIERQAWRLRHLESLTHRDIAERLGVVQSTVTRALQRQEEQLRKLFIDQAQRVKLEQTACLQAIYEEAIAGWRRSLEDDVTKTETWDGASTTNKRVTRGQSGNPQLLAQAREALADIRRIWGLDAPARQDLTTGGNALGIVIREVTVELPADDDDDAGGEPEAPSP